VRPMRWAPSLVVVASLGSWSCKNGPSDAATRQNTIPADGRTEAPAMTNLDPNDPAAWAEAEAVAAAAAPGQKLDRYDALPFMFMADRPAAVLVHHGRVVTETGAKVAGGYLRDLGIIDGRGPTIEHVLFALFALDAWPPVKDVAKERYINNPHDDATAELNPAVHFDGVTAQVILHYWVVEPGADQPDPDDGNVRGSRGQPSGRQARPILRCTLTIAKTGDPAWTVEQQNWAM
jgi:hypothetical protein